jgi:outer membrane protein assembly factor BamB
VGAGLNLSLWRSAFQTRLAGIVTIVGLAAAPSSAQTISGPLPPSFRLAWLAEPGAESHEAGELPTSWRGRLIPAVVPGTLYVLRVGEDGTIVKRRALACDPSPVYGVSIHASGVAVAGMQGDVELWRFTSANDLALSWSQALGERITSIRWDGGARVFAATWDGRLHALDRTGGARLWSADLGGRADAPPLLLDSTVYVATKANDLHALVALSGAERWRVSLPAPVIHPLAVGGSPPDMVFCVTWDGQLLAINADTGKVRWTQNLSGRAAGAPFVVWDTVAVVTADGSVTCYDFTGETRWQARNVAEGPAELKLAHSDSGSRLLVISGTLAALDPSRGTRLTEYPAGAIEALKNRFLEAMIEGEKRYSETEKQRLIEERAFALSGRLHGTASLAENALVFGTDEGWIYIFNGSSLNPLWRYRSGRASIGPLRLAEDRLLVCAGHEVFAYDARAGRFLWRRNVGGAVEWLGGGAKPIVIAGGRLSAFAAETGTIAWRTKEEYDVVAAALDHEQEQTPACWIAGNDKGELRALTSSGNPIGKELALFEPLLGIVPMEPKAWLVVTRSGRLLHVVWNAAPTAHLAQEWEMTIEEKPSAFDLEGDFLLARGENYAFGIDLALRREAWRVAVMPNDRVRLSSNRNAVLVCGGRDLRVLSIKNGQDVISHPTTGPALAADWKEGWLVWLDPNGHAYRSSASDAQGIAAFDFGAPLEQAEAVAGGFVVTSRVGEVGFIEVALDERPSSSADSLTGGIRQ